MIDLPQKTFLYTVDQIATMINVSERTCKQKHLFYSGRSVGSHDLDRMFAVNIAPEGSRPDWRVSEKEFKRWLKRKGFRFREMGR